MWSRGADVQRVAAGGRLASPLPFSTYDRFARKVERSRWTSRQFGHLFTPDEALHWKTLGGHRRARAASCRVRARRSSTRRPSAALIVTARCDGAELFASRRARRAQSVETVESRMSSRSDFGSSSTNAGSKY